MEKDITKLNIPELKALAYDLIAAREEATRQLSIVNQVITQRSSKLVKEVKPKPVDTKPAK